MIYNIWCMLPYTALYNPGFTEPLYVLWWYYRQRVRGGISGSRAAVPAASPARVCVCHCVCQCVVGVCVRVCQ